MNVTGKRGEDEACRYLAGEGHTIVERNWRSGRCEIDIISADGRGLHFVEVKSRTAPTSADPEVNVNRAKQRHLVQAALQYLHSAGRRFPDAEVSFDIITVVFDNNTTYINYYPQAFIPIYDRP
jgi:putative endonuclease